MNKKLLLASLNLDISSSLSLLDKDINILQTHQAFSLDRYNAYLKAYESYLGFSFFDDDEYPQPLKESVNPPYYLHYLGSIEQLKYPIALLGDYKAEDGSMKLAFNFALELLLNNITILTGTGGGIEEAIRECGIYTKTPIYAVDNMGIMSRKKFNYTPIMLSGGAVISMGDPYSKWSVEGNKQKAYLISHLASALIILPTDNYYTIVSIVDEAINLGKDVFILKEALSSKIGYKYAQEGATIIDGAGHFLDYYNLERKQILLPNESGDIWYKGERFKEYKLN